MSSNKNNGNHKITDGSGMHPRNFTNCPSSPATQGRSLREVEEQIAALRKENFNLKLRIYFLEEKPASMIAKSSSLGNSCMNLETIDSINKQNIDLKVMTIRFNSLNALFTQCLRFTSPTFFSYVFLI